MGSMGKIRAVLCAGFAFFVVFGLMGAKSFAAKAKYSTPTLSCPAEPDDNTIDLGVCAGSTGAPAGFSVQWMTCEAFEANGFQWLASDDAGLCKASFGGNANNSAWDLAANACTSVVIGGLNDSDPGVSFNCNDPLACETCYVFRSFAHANKTANRSDFSSNLECSTGACEDTGFEDGDFCTRSQGYYGSGANSRSAMVTCEGGDPTGATCTSSAGNNMVSLGGNVYTYQWVTTGSCVDVQPGGGVFLMDSGLAALRNAIGGGGASSYFTANGLNTANMGTGGGLGSQTGALTLNVNYSGAECTENPAGYGDAKLCNFAEGDTFKNDGTPISQATADALNGQSVTDVLAAANAYLGGNGAALPYSLTSAADLNELVANLNLAFDLKDWDGDGVDDHECGGMTSFAEDHLCQ